MNLSEYREFLPLLAEESGKVIAPHFRDPGLSVDDKSDASPVTVADRNAELRLRELIGRKYPSHGILGEEFGGEREGADWVWVLDPIDGTKAFITGCPLFGTLIALLHQGRPVLGAIHQPILKQLCIGDGRETTFNGKRTRVRSGRTLEQATLLYTERETIAAHQKLSEFETLEARCKIVRTWGDCYGYLLLASGFADIMLDAIMNPWDLMALVPIVEGAGGVITDWQGGDVVTSDSAVAALPELHPEVLRVLNP